MTQFLQQVDFSLSDYERFRTSIEVKQIQAQLDNSQRQYEQLINTIDGIVWEADAQTFEFSFVSQQAERLLGYPAERWVDEPTFWQDHLHPEDRDKAINFCIIASSEQRPYESEYRMIASDGRIVWLRDIVTVVIEDGRSARLRGVMTDITQRVQAFELLEERVSARTQELQSLLEVSRSFASTLELTSLLDLVLDQLHTLADYRDASLLALRDHTLTLLGHRGTLTADHHQRSVDWWQMHVDAIEQGQIVSISDVWDETAQSRRFREWATSAETDRMCSLLAIPLIVHEQVIGLITLSYDEPNFYTEQRIQMATAIASQIAVALENARLYEQAGKLAALEERQRLARELHDSVSQALYGISLGARTARALVDGASSDDGLAERLSPSLDYVLSLAEAGLKEMRALIFELRPESLELDGLVAVLTRQAAAIEARYQISVDLTLCPEPDVPFAVKEALYRIAQEALNNIVKHASASEVTVELLWADGQLTLEVRDNGRGFDPQEDFPGHLGLQSMRERMQAIRGNLEISSHVGQGSTVLAAAPTTSVCKDTNPQG